MELEGLPGVLVLFCMAWRLHRFCTRRNGDAQASFVYIHVLVVFYYNATVPSYCWLAVKELKFSYYNEEAQPEYLL